jgi:hypothetical protein
VKIVILFDLFMKIFRSAGDLDYKKIACGVVKNFIALVRGSSDA